VEAFLRDPDLSLPERILAKDLAVDLAKAADISKGDALELIKFTCELIAAHLIAGHNVVLPRLGRFAIQSLPTRSIRNPKTGERNVVGPSSRARFKLSQKIGQAIADASRRRME
jgi:nucleoid DNA-binding protein